MFALPLQAAFMPMLSKDTFELISAHLYRIKSNEGNHRSGCVYILPRGNMNQIVKSDAVIAGARGLAGLEGGRANAPLAYRHFSPEALKLALRRMHLVRRFEEEAEASYMRGLIHGTMHLSIGQEASAVGITLPLTASDYITSTHRGHGHCIGKGADPKRMFAEFFGKEEGYCRGRGGSMHIADPKAGNLGANGIVAGGIPIAVGAALAIKRQGRKDVAVSFFGDGASNEGAFHEALNMAAIWKLPVIFVCENNKYGMSVSTERSMAVKNVADRAPAYAMPCVIVDGNDFSAVAEAAILAVERARQGDGPTLIECKTYRTRGHSRSDRNRYRSKEEIDEWIARDPIPRLQSDLIAYGIASAEDCEAIAADVEAEIADALIFAAAGTSPAISTLLENVYTV
jgi:acetoin:2,6-dichlorophenolindophenol oxidoreductase subunit alpha